MTATDMALQALQALPFHIRVRAFTKTELYRSSDHWCQRAASAERINDKDGAELAESRYNAVWDELDRRETERQKREQRTIARLQKLAGVTS